MKAHVGQPAPDFTARAYVRGLAQPQTISLAALRGRWAILFFYHHDFAYLCPEELRAFARLRREFAQEGAVVLGANTGSYHSHWAWFEGDARLDAVTFPVLADTNQQLSAAFRVLRDGRAIMRATFIIDPAGIIRHMHVNDLGDGHTAEETLHMLRGLRAGERAAIDAPTVPSPETAQALAITVV